MRAFFVAVVAVALTTAVSAIADSAEITDAEATRDGTRITLTWSATGPVDVLISGDPTADPELMTEISANDRDGKHVVLDLRGVTRPYFYLRPNGGAGVRVATRLLPLEGGRNFRDMGGYPTEDGRHVKWGHVFRSGMMAGLTDGDYSYLSALGIQVVCDLRANEERADEPTDWRAGDAEYLTWDYSTVTGSEDLRAMFQDPDLNAAKVKMTMTNMYPGILEEQKDRYREIFHRLAAGEIPLAFNCSAGKDRAGTSAALILSALGVPRELVVQDYSLSETYVDYEAAYTNVVAADMEDSPYGFLAQLPAELRAPLLRSDPEYIRKTFDYLDEIYGGVMAFIRTELDIDDMELAAIRSQLLE
jgi:protein-tyrosine phosphatase